MSNTIYNNSVVIMLDKIIDFLQIANIRRVAKDSFLSYPTVLNIKNGKNKTPNLRTVKKLADYYNLKD